MLVIGWSGASNGLYDISGLQYATGIQNLSIYYTSVSNLNGIQYLTNLKTFYCYDNFSKISDISYLSNLTKLETVSLKGQNISSIPDLSKLTQLSSLNLSNNNIADLSPLEKIIIDDDTSLTSLNLANNLIEEYTSAGFDNLGLLRKLKNAGTTSITITGNNFTTTPTI